LKTTSLKQYLSHGRGQDISIDKNILLY